MAPINVLVVDDSVVVRRLVTTALEADPDIKVVGTAPNGKVALDKLSQVAPDAVTLDVEMPVMDGVEALRRLRVTHPRLPVIMFSTLTDRGAVATLDALAAGASDYVTKPANVGSVPEALEAVRQQLIPKLKALCAHARPAPSVTRSASTAAPRAARKTGTSRADVLCIGASTGGPEALTRVIPGLPADLPVPVVVVQHMPPVFTATFAGRLNGQSAVEVREAVDGDLLRPGVVLIAPGGLHMALVRRGDEVRISLNEDPPENWCRPAVDVLFRSVAEIYGEHTLAVVLTGMGSDGARGVDAIQRSGGSVLVQDEATSVVWGMPGAVVEAGLADQILPLDQVAATVLDQLRGGRIPGDLSMPSTVPRSTLR